MELRLVALLERSSTPRSDAVASSAQRRSRRCPPRRRGPANVVSALISSLPSTVSFEPVRLERLHEARGVLRRQPDDDAVGLGVLDLRDLVGQADRGAGRPVLADRVVECELLAASRIRKLDRRVAASAVGARVVQHREGLAVLQRVTGIDRAPRVRVESAAPDPRCGRLCRTVG